MKRNDTRSVFVYGNLWEYKVGRTAVSFYGPEGEKFHKTFNEIFQQEKIASHPQITPSFIGAYIKNVILADRFENQKMNICEHCNKRKPDVILRKNPYAAEINEDYTKHYLCNDCSDLLADEI